MNSDVVSEDARLVQLGALGDRDAFGRLVARYQSPVCALAYSSCGNVSQSEDLAQETFIVAWRKLSDLREPEKFKFWLFGIARNLISNTARKQTRNPLASAGPLDEEMTMPVFGVLFACGGVAVAPVSIGGWSSGLVSLGGFVTGALAIGGFTVGVWSVGGFAFGWQAIGGCAVAWNAAWGGMAIAHFSALGGVVHAGQANNPFVWQLLAENRFFQIFKLPFPFFYWLNLIWLVPLTIRWIFMLRRNGQKAQASVATGLTVIAAAIGGAAIFEVSATASSH